MDRRIRESLDRHITGNYGEDQFTEELSCPKCNSTSVVGCKGGTSLKHNPKINYICEDCLLEW